MGRMSELVTPSRPPLRQRVLGIGAHIIVIVGVMLVLDQLYWQTGIRVGFWIALGALLIITLWPDLYRLIVSEITRQPSAIPLQPLRSVYGFLITALLFALLSRPVANFIGRSNPPLFQISLLVSILAIAFWDEFANYTAAGQRWLAARAAKRLAITLVAVIVILTAIEAVLNNPYARRNLVGNWTVAHYSGELNERNTSGFRDSEHEIAKPEGVVRILVLGDSVTWGKGTPPDQVYTARLDQYGGANVEVINAALSGDTMVDHIIRMRDYGCQFAPDILLVGVNVSDWAVVSSDEFPQLEIPWLPPAEPFELSTRVFRELESDFSYNPLLLYVLDARIDEALRPVEPPSLTEEEWDSVFSYWHAGALELATVAKACGVKHLYAFALPAKHVLMYDFARITETYADAGFEATNLEPQYRADFGQLPWRALWASYDDGHPNAELHQWYADQMWPVIETAVDEERH